MIKTIRGILTAKPIRAILRTLPLPEVIYRSLHFRDTIEVPLRVAPGSFKCIHHGYQVENDLYWAGFAKNWEGQELSIWLALAEKAKVICDIGANTGVFSLAAGAINPKAKILAFEPMPPVFNKLAANVKLNSFDITAHDFALSDSDGEMTFFEPDSAHAYSATLDPEMAKQVNASVERQIQVRRFDGVVKDAGLENVDLIKLDAEMHEPEVLSGFGDVIQTYRPVFLIEVLSLDLGERVWAHFENAEYEFRAITESGIVAASKLGSESANYLLYPTEKSKMIVELS